MLDQEKIESVSTTMAVPVVEVATVEGLKNHFYKRVVDGGIALVAGAGLLFAKFGFDQWSRSRARIPSTTIPNAPGVVHINK